MVHSIGSPQLLPRLPASILPAGLQDFSSAPPLPPRRQLWKAEGGRDLDGRVKGKHYLPFLFPHRYLCLYFYFLSIDPHFIRISFLKISIFFFSCITFGFFNLFTLHPTHCPSPGRPLPQSFPPLMPLLWAEGDPLGIFPPCYFKYLQN
jgi:hypothetical protein